MPVPLLIIPAVAAAASSGISAGVIAGSVFASVGTTAIAIKAFFTFRRTRKEKHPDALSQRQENHMLDRIEKVDANIEATAGHLKTMTDAAEFAKDVTLQASVDLKETTSALRDVERATEKGKQVVQAATDSFTINSHLLKDIHNGLSHQAQKMFFKSIDLIESLGKKEGALSETQEKIKALKTVLELKMDENSELESKVRKLSVENTALMEVVDRQAKNIDELTLIQNKLLKQVRFFKAADHDNHEIYHHQEAGLTL